MSLTLGRFQQKVMTQFYEKVKKTQFQALFGPFLVILQKTGIFLENLVLSIFSFSNFCCCEEFQEKLMNRSQKKLITEIQTMTWVQRCTDKHEFIALSLLGFQEMYLKLPIKIEQKYYPQFKITYNLCYNLHSIDVAPY